MVTPLNLFDYVLNVTKMFALKALNSNSGIKKNSHYQIEQANKQSKQAKNNKQSK